MVTANNYLNNYNASAAYNAYSASATQSTGKVSISGSYLDITGGQTGSRYNTTDSADISTSAQDLLDRVKSLDVFSCIYPNSDATKSTKSLGQVKNDFFADFNDFSSYFGTMSGMMGISSGSSFTMGLNGVGGMTVSGSNSAMASQLQSSFSNNETLTSRYAIMAARASLTDAGSTIPGFKEAYAKDPVKAIQDYESDLKDRLLGFRTVASEGTMQYGFMRDVDMEIEYSSTTASYAAAAAVEE